MSNSFSIVLRRDYLDLIKSMAAGIEGKVIRCAATLIAYYRHWQEWKQKHQRTDWVYQPLRQIYVDLMGLFSMPVIRAANDLLIDLDLLERRGNPGNGQDKTYQYNVLFERVRKLLPENPAVSPLEKTSVSAATSNFSSLTVNTHHNIQSNKVIFSNQDAIEKYKPEDGGEIVPLATQEELLAATKEQGEIRLLTAGSLDVEQSSAQTLDSDEDIKAVQQCVAALNTKVEQQDRDRPQQGQQKSKPICIPDLDEETHKILWKHQEQLEKLNADLNAERIKSAILDNPQHLEAAIEALFENSAKGARTKECATGFLFNALRQGWKPRHSSSILTARVQVYTPPPQMLEEHKPGTLEQLIERKRLMWQNAPNLRSIIEAWIEQTPGVMRTDDGPALADANNQPSPQDLELKAGSHQITSTTADTRPLAENVASPPLEQKTLSEVEPNQVFNGALPQKQVHLADLEASNPNPLPLTAASAAEGLPTKPSAFTPPQLKQKQSTHRRLQPVEILTSAGDWVAGYFIHQCIAIANLIGIEQKFTLFDADGGAYTFLGQVRPL